MNVIELNAQDWDIPVSKPAMEEHRSEPENLVMSVDELKTLHVNYKNKYLIANTEATRTRVAIKAKEEAKAIFLTALRHFIKEFIVYNSRITDADRVNLGLKPHKKTHTPAPVAKTFPVSRNVVSVAPGIIVFHVDDSEGRKPDMTKGFVCRYAILDQPPASWENLPHKAYSQASTLTLEFDLNLRGKTLYYAFCWENTRGQHGNWGTIGSMIIG
jgi:hypothetical protein